MKGIVVLEPQSPGLEKEASVNKNSCFFPLFESLEVLCCNKCDKISHIERLKSQLKNCRHKTHKFFLKNPASFRRPVQFLNLQAKLRYSQLQVKIALFGNEVQKIRSSENYVTDIVISSCLLSYFTVVCI